MATNIYRLFGSGTASADAVAAIDIRDSGRIVGVFAVLSVDTTTNSLRVTYELSFGSSRQPSTNDTQNVVIVTEFFSNFTTSGLQNNVSTSAAFGINIPVDAGERLYIHRDVSSAPTASRYNVCIYCEQSAARRYAQRRR